MSESTTLPANYRLLETHEWHSEEGGIVTIGITQFAADELTDVTYVELPKVGAKIAANARFGTIESVKATSDLYTGVAGTVVEVHSAINDDPALVNKEPYTGGWLIKLQADDAADVQKLHSAIEYLTKTGQG